MSKPGLTKQQRRRLGRYIRQIADQLNLRDWAFTVMHEPLHSTDRALAACTITFGRHHAELEFGAHFAECSPEVQREVVVHELLHCWIPASRPGGLWGLEELVGRPAALVACEAYREQQELATDGIANAIAQMFPLPPKL